jgi:hypothetical protein
MTDLEEYSLKAKADPAWHRANVAKLLSHAPPRPEPTIAARLFANLWFIGVKLVQLAAVVATWWILGSCVVGLSRVLGS